MLVYVRPSNEALLSARSDFTTNRHDYCGLARL